MLRLVYFSTADANITQAQVDEIVDQASVANAANSITGALAYNGRNFCQCLEGAEADVRVLMEKITEDPRHAGVKVIDEKPVESRYFGDWGMMQVDGLDFSRIIDAMKA